MTIKDDTKKTGLISKRRANDSNDNNIYYRLDVVYKVRRREVRCVENVGDEPITVMAKFCGAQVIIEILLK